MGQGQMHAWDLYKSTVCVCVCVQRTVFLSISNYIMSVNTLAHHELILVETPLEIILVRNRWYSKIGRASCRERV